MFYRKCHQNQIPSRGEPSILILPWCMVLAGFTTASHETRTLQQAEVKDACDSRLLRWPWPEKGSSNISITCSFSPLNSPLVLLLPQRLRLSWRTWQLPQGRNGTAANTLSPTASEVASSCLRCHKALSWLREKNWCILHCLFFLFLYSFCNQPFSRWNETSFWLQVHL